ncbi:MAG: peptide-methionine (S)-S-oxide reductase, partial [Akkermansiaceae bacterium]
APEDHDNYYNRNPNQGYCQAVISPKIAKFRKTFQHLLASDE